MRTFYILKNLLNLNLGTNATKISDCTKINDLMVTIISFLFLLVNLAFHSIPLLWVRSSFTEAIKLSVPLRSLITSNFDEFGDIWFLPSCHYHVEIIKSSMYHVEIAWNLPCENLKLHHKDLDLHFTINH